jgi:two-component system chemotaxis sensor kinase CheA
MTTSPNLSTFFHEVEDLLDRIEAAALALEATPGDPECIGELFRAFHTLKGSAGVAGVGSIAAFTHHVESAMDKVRNGEVTLTPPLITAVLAAKDHVAQLLAVELGGAPADHDGQELIARLAELTATGRPSVENPAIPKHGPGLGRVTRTLPTVAVDYLVSFTLGADAPAGLDPLTILADLEHLGACTELQPLPTWRLVVTTVQPEAAIRDAFIFIEGAGTLQIDRGMSAFVLDEPAPVAASPSPVARAESAASLPAAAPVEPDARRRAAAVVDSTVRVSAERLDHLVKLIGELVITQSRLTEAQTHHPNPEAAGPVEAMDRLIGDLRDSVLGLRMVPIGTIFTRFHRLIRDLSAELGKDVDLVTAGDETELDKNVIDQLGEPLIHILRNSLDHGLETPEDRVAAGKSPRGTLRLAAAHEGTHVVVTITDDGKGVDAAAVRKKAEAQGLIERGAQLSEQETIALIMRPGFSTATTVTQVSGRGVGMDVVKRTLEALRGTVEIRSRPGHGTELRLTLPLTLAIIDGLLVEIRGDRFIIPVAAVTENVELTRDERRAQNGRAMLGLRGELIPYIRLREMFDMPEDEPLLEKIVVVAAAGRTVGLVVDRVIGNHQTVIQPLGRFGRGVHLFAGTTILGDGRVALILDLAGIVNAADDGTVRLQAAS